VQPNFFAQGYSLQQHLLAQQVQAFNQGPATQNTLLNEALLKALNKAQ